MKRYIWMAVTPDQYETPIYTAPTAQALATILGVHVGTIFKLEHMKCSGKLSGRKIIKIEGD